MAIPCVISARRLLGGLCVFGLVCAAPVAQAASGEVDPTFGTAGWVSTDFGALDDAAFAVAVQEDGKTVAAGTAFGGVSYDFALARYNPDGSLDDSFGSGGKVLTDLGSQFWDSALAVDVQPDGKIIAAGFGRAANGFDPEIAVVRYNVDGSLDTSFGIGGKVQTGFVDGVGLSSSAEAIALQSDGKIVVGGSSWFGVSRFTVVRYRTDGTLDTGFGIAGVALADVGDGEARALALQPDGKIVTAGHSRAGGLDFALARMNADGSLDGTFGTGGVVVTDFGSGPTDAWDVAIQPDGGIVAVGVGGDAPSQDYALARYLADGSLDVGFGSTGMVLTDVNGGSDEATAMALLPDGRIVAVGSSSGAGGGPSLVRYETDGSLDATFGAGGKVLLYPWGALGTGVNLSDAALQSDGRLVASGRTGTPPGDFALVRVVVYEKSAQELLADLMAILDDYALDRLGPSLHDKLVTVQRMLEAGKSRQACENLASFVRQVDAQTDKGLTPEQAGELTTRAEEITQAIGC